MRTFDILRQIIAAMFLAAFVGVWIWISIKLYQFNPSEQTPTLVLPTGFITMSGMLSSTVGAGTAAVLGIEVQKAKFSGKSLGGSVATGATSSVLIIAAVLAYLAVGVLLGIMWLAKGDASPEVVQSFALGSLGWMGGAFVSIFVASE